MNRNIPPAIQPFSHFPLIEPHKNTLSNGLSCFTFYDAQLELIHLQIKVKAGTLYETQKYLQQATFQMLKESSAQYPAEKLEEYLDFCGASWSCNVNLDYTSLQWVIPKHTIRALLPILVETLAQPLFTESSLNLFKDQKIKDLEYNLLRTSYVANQHMYNALFDVSPVKDPLTTQHIQNITIQHLIECHQKVMIANNITLFVAGDVDDSLQQFINQTFSNITAGASILTLAQLSNNPTSYFYEERPDALQSTVIICKKSMDYHHPDKKKFSFLTTLFGGYFGSRLMKKIREEKGYTYGIHNYNSYFGNESIFMIKSDVNAEATQATIEECFYEMEHLINNGIELEEMETVRNYLLGKFLRQVDGVTSLMGIYSFWNHFGKDTTEGEHYVNGIKSITVEEVIRLAKELLQPDSFHTIVVGKNLAEKK